jgi:hypothetical protein
VAIGVADAGQVGAGGLHGGQGDTGAAEVAGHPGAGHERGGGLPMIPYDLIEHTAALLAAERTTT